MSFTEVLVQESGDPLLSKTNVHIPIQFYDIVPNHLDRAILLGHQKAIQETTNICLSKY
jgi:hypothetical protein